jgi:hypothetical protein
MTITFPDGTRHQAALLTRSQNNLCVAVQGWDDASVFTRINGTWISEQADPVSIEFEWEKRQATVPSLDDCICDKRLASRLIARLLNPSDEDLLETALSDLPDGISASAACHAN